MKRLKVILNPVAGRGLAGRIEGELQRNLVEAGLTFELVRTKEPGHAVELSSRAGVEGFDGVVAVGGDGTANEVVNGLMAASRGGETLAMGVIPVGSGSDFAYAAGVPKDLLAACLHLVNGNSRLLDVGRVTISGQEPRYFDNTVGIGFDAIVTLESQKVKLLRGMALYLPVVLKTVFLYGRSPTVTVAFDGREVTIPAMMVVVANGPREGGGFYVTPDARPDDGLLDLCITRELGRLATLAMIPHFMKGTHVGREPVTMAQAKKVTISSDGDLIVHADGEMVATAAHRLEFEIFPRRLRVLG